MSNNLNPKSNLCIELQFLIACCQVEPSEEMLSFIVDYIDNFSSKKYDELITLAKQHGILPLVYKCIKNLPSPSKSSITLCNKMKSHYKSIAISNMSMSAELIHIVKLLKDNSIEALAFKGPTLSQMAYKDITLRQFGDLDILISKKDQFAALKTLVNNGYELEIDLKENTKETFFKHVNVIGLYKKSTGIYVEIHWELLSKNYAIKWKEESLWQKKAYTQINFQNIRTLDTKQLLLYLCTHSSKHLFERLEWICDIDRTIRANPKLDWDLLLQEANKLGIRRMLYLSLALCKLFFHLKLPKNIQNELKKDKELNILIPKIIDLYYSQKTKKQKNYNSFLMLLNMRENLNDKLSFAWYGLFSTKFDDFKYIQLPNYLSFLYPIVRPFRLLTKYFKH
jgi:hypothetical protein